MSVQSGQLPKILKLAHDSWLNKAKLGTLLISSTFPKSAFYSMSSNDDTKF